MQIANIMLRLGGDADNTVPKFGVTPAEIAVLRLIHGEDAVRDIQPIGSVNRSNRAELSRLRGFYESGNQPDNKRPVTALFPGAAARVFEKLDELDIPEVCWKAGFAPEAKAEVEADDVDTADAIDDDDGIGDMDPPAQGAIFG